jgi:hypothetical protein
MGRRLTLEVVASSGDARADEILCGTVELFVLLFPGRLRAVYLEGSYADATSLATSDLDLTLIFRNRFRTGEAEQAQRALDSCAALSSLEFDAAVVDEQMLMQGAWPTLKLGGVLVWGVDLRAGMALDRTAWTRDRMHTSYYRLGALFGRGGVVRVPLDYPTADGEFFGYDARTMRLGDGREVASTRDLIRAAGWAATALVAHRTGRFIARKGECAQAYRDSVGGEYAQWLEELFAYCRGRWQYRIPDDLDERATLHALCMRMVDFERYFLAAYGIQRFVLLSYPTNIARHLPTIRRCARLGI